MNEFKRMILKVSSITNDVATIPTTNDHQDGSWLDTDIYIGELFLNVADNILQTRTDTGIVEVYGGVVGVDWGSISGTLSNQTDLQTALDTKQIELVSGTNIKTINGTTILGSGNIVAGGKFVDGTDILDAVYTAGNVGIGTVTPSEALDVVGKISLNDGGNSVFVGDNAGVNDDGTSNNNVGVGTYALQNNTTGANNTGNGHQALRNNTTGANNVANGTYALVSNIAGSYNVANGFESLTSNTSGNNNVSNGFRALKNNTTGGSNTANGYQALFNNTTGSNNVANGSYALQNNTTGVNNVSNGYQSLQKNTTGVNNVANGVSALQNNTTGNNNVANGLEALRLNTTGNNNVANGFQSLVSNTNGYGNTANGYISLYLNTTGSKNVANGRSALQNNTTGNNNVANGFEALKSNTTGANNVANGYEALKFNTTGASNVANGFGALYNNTTGINNTANGRNSGRFIANGGNNQTGGNSLFLGYDTRPLNNGETNQIVIGYEAVGSGSNTVTLGNTSITKTQLRGDVLVDSALLSNQENTDVDTGTETVAEISTTDFTAAFFDYVIKNGVNVRAGTVYACHDGLLNVEHSETSTNDLGDTSGVTLSVDISGGNIRLRATTTSDNWSIKSLVRGI